MSLVSKVGVEVEENKNKIKKERREDGGGERAKTESRTGEED